MSDAAVPILRSEQRRARQLVVSRRRATALLVAVTGVFVAVTLMGGRRGWAAYVQATAEASMVGGLADWFAVTALFRRPLGLPIPHTAIVAERKNQFGATLGEFIQESFLTPAVIVERVRGADVVGRATEWLAQPANASRLAAQVADAAVALADLLNDDDIRDTIEGVVRRRVEGIALAPLAGRVLRHLTEDGRHRPVLDALLTALDRYLDEHRSELRGRLGEQSPWWLPGAVEDRMFERLLDGARTALRDMVTNPENSFRQELEAAVTKLATDLESSADLRDRGEQLKSELVSQPQLRGWATTLWRELKEEMRTEAAEPSSPLRRRLESSAVAVGDRLSCDPALRTKLEAGTESAVCYVAEHFNGEISALVSGTIARWDAEETSRRLELLLGPDLQYIRINGTLVGGLAGLALYAIAHAL